MIIDGKKISEKIYQDIKKTLIKMKNQPGLGVILIGKDPASKIYVALKEKQASKLGIKFFKKVFSENVSEKRILNQIDEFNNNDSINGILIQMPLPKHLNAERIFQAINYKKDVDGFSKKSPVISPLVLATIESLKSTKIILKNKKAALLVNSKIFGDALKENLNKELKISSKIFLPKNEDWNFIKKADIVICARGVSHFLKADYIKSGVILIDIGITRYQKKVLGDISLEAQRQSSFYTPVPGGIGPLTVAFLFKNLVDLANFQSI